MRARIRATPPVFYVVIYLLVYYSQRNPPMVLHPIWFN